MKNKFLKACTTALIAAGLVTGGAVAANATPEPYVLVAWKINTPDFVPGGDVWGGGGQTDPIALPTSSTDLDQVKPLVPCGIHVQIDLYNNDEITAALLATGHLYGPNRPTESPATGVNPWYIASWYSGDCAPEPADKPYSDSGETFACDYVTHWNKEGFYAKTFDPVANVWTYATEPTVVTETSSQTPTTYEQQLARGCIEPPVTEEPEPPASPQPPSELAETGIDNPFHFAVIVVTGVILVAGGVLLVIRKRRLA